MKPLHHSFRSLLLHSYKNYADLPLFVTSVNSVTYKEFVEKSFRYCCFIKNKQEKLVAIQRTSPIEYASAVLGVILAGHIACLMPDNQWADTTIAQDCFILDDTVDANEPIQNSLFSDLDPTDEDAPCVIAFSSGTSADPKGILLNQRSLLLSALNAAAIHGFWKGERLVHVLPYWHLFGLAADLIAPLAYGCSVFIQDSPLCFFSSLRFFKPDSINAPPALAIALCKTIEQNDAPSVTGGALKKILVAGAPLKTDVATNLISHGIMPCTAYGLTECSPCVSITTPDDVRIGTVGKPIDCVSVAFATDGEILVSGDSIMIGYIDENETKLRVVDGWFHTGDIGYLDTAGHLVITGRKSSMIVFSNGKKCIPEPIEGKINMLPGVEESLLTASNDNDHAVLIVVSKMDRETLERDIDAIMHDAGIQTYRLVVQTTGLTKNSLGKVVRRNDERVDINAE